MVNILIISLATVLFISCRNKDAGLVGEKENRVNIAGQGSVTYLDSIPEKKIKLAEKPLILSPGKVQIKSANNNVHKAGRPLEVHADTLSRILPADGIIHYPDTVVIEMDPIPAGIPNSVFVNDPTIRDINPENFFSFGKLQGLKNSTIKNIIQDRSGNLWIGTYGSGATRYDGKYFTHFTEKEGLSNNYINCILEDRNGNILFGTDGGGLSIFDGTHFTTINEKNGLPNKNVYSLLEDTEGDIWLATRGGGAVRLKNNKLIVYTKNEGLADNDIFCLLQDSKKQIWFGTNGGVSKFDGDKFISFVFKDEPPVNRIQSVFEDENNIMWFGTYEMGLLSYDGNHFRRFTEKEGLSDNTINCITGDNNGSIWIGTQSGGIIKYDGTNFCHLGSQEGLPNNSVSSIVKDFNGDMWIGTYGGGVVKHNGDLFTFLTSDEGLTNYDAYGICCDREGNIWFGPGGGGVVKYDGNLITFYNPGKGIAGATVMDILNDSKGDIWFASYGKGVSRFDGTEFHGFTKDQGLGSDYIYCMLEDNEGNYWFGTSGNGISKYDGKYFTSYTEKDGLCSSVILSILQDSNGDIWFGSFGGGLSRFDGKSFTNYSVNDGLASNYIYSIIQDDFGKLWFGTNGNGVSCYNGQFFFTLTEEDGLSNNSVLFMHKDKSGSLWLGTRIGVNKLTSEKNKWLSDYLIRSAGSYTEKINLADQFIFKTYTYDDGFLGVGCSRGSVCEDLEGNLWIGANEKLTVYHPSGDKAETVAPIVQLTGVDLFNEIIPWSNLSGKNGTSLLLRNGVRLKNPDFESVTRYYGIPVDLSLRHDNNFIMFRFLGISISQNKKISYQYILEGLDKNWSALSTRNEASYGNLSPGRYVFRVRAINSDGLWGKEFTYPFAIRPPWWKTWVFRILIVIITFSVVIGFYNWRVADLKTQKRLLEESVREKTSELVNINEELKSVNDNLKATNRELDLQSKELNATLKHLKETQDQLIQSEKMASLGILVAGVAHEINNPLNFIAGGAYVLEDFFKNNLPEKFEEIRPVVEGINTGVNRASAIVKSLSLYSRNNDLPFSGCNLHDIIDDCLTILNNQLYDRVEVHKHYTNKQYSFEGNEGKLHQAFLNILANASQAIAEKGKITILTEIAQDEIHISITDTGQGIPPENLKRVFDPFFTTNDPGKGTGLGLSITYSIIQEHNGTIELDSQVGDGTRVKIKLPLKRDGSS